MTTKNNQTSIRSFVAEYLTCVESVIGGTKDEVRPTFFKVRNVVALSRATVTSKFAVRVI